MELRHEAVADYAFDVLDVEQRTEFEVHLARCALCRRDLAEIRRGTLALALVLEPVEPPAALRERILAAARLEPQEHRSRLRAAFHLPPTRWSVQVVAAVAAVLFVTGAPYRLQENRHAAAGAEAIAGSFAGRSGAHRIPLQGTPGALVYDASGQALLYLPRLARAPADHVYEAWVIDSGRSRPAGTFPGGAPVAQRLTQRVSPGSSIVAVSVEAAAGGSIPHGPLAFATAVPKDGS